MKKYESSFIKREDIKVDTGIDYRDDVRHSIVKITHIPTQLHVLVESKIGQLSAYNTALKILEEKLIKSSQETNKIMEINRLNKSLDSLKKNLKDRPKQYKAMSAGYINKIKELKNDEKV